MTFPTCACHHTHGPLTGFCSVPGCACMTPTTPPATHPAATTSAAVVAEIEETK